MKQFEFTTDVFGWNVQDRVQRNECRASGITIERDLISGLTVIEVSSPKVVVHDLAEVRDNSRVTLKSLVARSADEYYARIRGTDGAALLRRVLDEAGQSDEARKHAGRSGGLREYQQYVERMRLDIATAAVAQQFLQELPKWQAEDAAIGIQPVTEEWVRSLWRNL